jgi:hypothetical protein
MVPTACTTQGLFGCKGSSRDPRLFPGTRNHGPNRPWNSNGAVWMHTRGGIPAFPRLFPGRSFHTWGGREGIPRRESERCLSLPAHSSGDCDDAFAEIPRLPPASTSDASTEVFLSRLLHAEAVLLVLTDDLAATRSAATWLAYPALLLLFFYSPL